MLFFRIFASDMPLHIPINILDFIFKGMLIGMIASAPMGPVGILCVQRTLNKGRWYGFATGLGAAISDIIYAGIAGFGMSFVMDFITNDQNRFYLQIVGSVMLLCFGLFTYYTDPTKKMHQSGQQKGSLWYNTWTAFLVTFSNPLIVFLFLAMYAQFAFVLPNHPFEMLVGFMSIVGGALLWWWGLTWLVDKIDYWFYYYVIGNDNKPVEILEMLIAQELRRKNIAEYLLYMWQVEDTIRAFGCSLSRIRREYIDRFDYTDEQKEDEADWFGNLIRMMNEEGCREKGHIQINKVVLQQLEELHVQLLGSSKFPFYNSEYYKVLPYIVELRNHGANKEENEIETCFNSLYGVMMLRLQKKEVSLETQHAIKEISTFIGMLNDYYLKDKQEPLEFE